MNRGIFNIVCMLLACLLSFAGAVTRDIRFIIIAIAFMLVGNNSLLIQIHDNMDGD